MGALYSLFASVEAAGLPQHSIVRRFDTRADAVVADRLGLDASTPLVYLERLRLAGDEFARAGPGVAAGRTRRAAAGRRLHPHQPLRRAGYPRRDTAGRSAGTRTSTGGPPRRAERAQLRCPPSTAAFSINRRSLAQGRPVEWRHTLVRGDRFALAADFAAGTGYRLAASPAIPTNNSNSPR